MANVVKRELTLDSREVAEMVGKRHSDLLRDIETYISYISQNANLRYDDFFLESSYRAGTGRTYKCYQVTRKGCEFIAHKLTGEKGAQFTATYINRFHEMEKQFLPQTIEDLIILQAQSVKELRQRVGHQQKQIETIKNALIHTDRDWRNWVNEQLNTIGFKYNNYREIKRLSYDILENRARCRLSVRLKNLRERLREAGATETAIKNTNFLDVIEEDPRLKEIYTSIVEKLAIKYSA